MQEQISCLLFNKNTAMSILGKNIDATFNYFLRIYHKGSVLSQYQKWRGGDKDKYLM